MDIVARYNIQRGKEITPLHKAYANYESDGSYIDNLILHRQAMYQKYIIDKAEYDKFIKGASADIYKELDKLFKDFR